MHYMMYNSEIQYKEKNKIKSMKKYVDLSGMPDIWSLKLIYNNTDPKISHN